MFEPSIHVFSLPTFYHKLRTLIHLAEPGQDQVEEIWAYDRFAFDGVATKFSLVCGTIRKYKMTTRYFGAYVGGIEESEL